MDVMKFQLLPYITPCFPGEPLQPKLPVHQRRRHAGLRLGGAGPEAELGGEGRWRGGKRSASGRRRHPPPGSPTGHESGKLVLLRRIVTSNVLTSTHLGSLKNHSTTRTMKCRSTTSCWNVMGQSSVYYLTSIFSVHLSALPTIFTFLAEGVHITNSAPINIFLLEINLRI